MNTRAKSQAHTPSQTPSRHALVLGGSLAGLLAARILADHANNPRIEIFKAGRRVSRLARNRVVFKQREAS